MRFAHVHRQEGELRRRNQADGRRVQLPSDAPDQPDGGRADERGDQPHRRVDGRDVEPVERRPLAADRPEEEPRNPDQRVQVDDERGIVVRLCVPAAGVEDPQRPVDDGRFVDADGVGHASREIPDASHQRQPENHEQRHPFARGRRRRCRDQGLEHQMVGRSLT